MAKKGNQAAAQRHERFAQEYVIDYNATRAYKAAGFRPGNDNVAGVEGHRLLKNPKVAARVAELEAEHLNAIGLRAHRILREQARVAFSDPANLVDEDGRVLSLKEMDVDTRAAIASIEVEEIFEYQGGEKELEPQPQGGALKRERKARKHVGNLVKVKLWNKNEAGANLMKHKGLFKADNDQKGAEVVRQFMEAVSGHSRGLPGRHQQRSR